MEASVFSVLPLKEKRNPHAIDEEWPGYFVYFMHQLGKSTAKAHKDAMNRPAVAYVGVPR